MTTDPELTSWQREWQSLGGGEDFAAKLAERARRDASRMRLSAAGEIGGVLFSTSVSMWLVVRSRGAVDVMAMVALILVFNGAWLTYFFTLREGAFSASGQSTATFVELTRRRFAIEKRWIRYSRRWTLTLIALLTPWMAWFAYRHYEFYRAEPWRAVVGFGVAGLILGGLLVWQRHKLRTTVSREAAFEAALQRADALYG